jgi:hypothetical protein
VSDCTCRCEPTVHKKGRGCTTWYGDKNTGFGCSCSWDGQPPKPTVAHHVLVIVQSDDRYIDVMTRVAAAVGTRFTGVAAQGVDWNKEQKRLAEALDERNLAVAEAHRLRCESEFLVNTLTEIAGRVCECHPDKTCGACKAQAALDTLTESRKT